MSESRLERARETLGAALVAFVAVACFTLVVVMPLDPRGQTLFAASLLAAALLAALSSSRAATLALVVASVLSSTRYLFWRCSTTIVAGISVDDAASALLLAAELYAFAMLLLGYFQSALPLERKPPTLPEDRASWPTIDLFIPTFNEPLSVVRTTLFAALALDWPRAKLNIILLDDGGREEFRAFAAELKIGYLARAEHGFAKAGNLNHALKQTRGEFVAVLDCDHVPTRSFLASSMGVLISDSRCAFVQLPHHFYSEDPFERNLRFFRDAPSEGELFYRLIQPGLDTWNASLFCGSCAILRRAALEEIGGFAVETVTEDAHTALRLHRRGWRSAYLSMPLVAGLATESLSALVRQRMRWARGMAQIFRIDNPLFGKGLRLGQRLGHTAAALHFFYGLPRIIFLLAPIAYPLFNLHIFNAPPILALAFALPHLAQGVLARKRTAGRFRRGFASEVYETCLAFHLLLPTTLALFAPKSGAFNVTAKGGRIEEPFFEWRVALPSLIFGALNVAAIAAVCVRFVLHSGATGVLAMSLAWALVNLLLLGFAVAAARENVQRRKSPRVVVSLDAKLECDGVEPLVCRTENISVCGALLDLASAGAHGERARALRAGELVGLQLHGGAGSRTVPALVVAVEGSRVRVRFDALAIAEEAALTEAIFSRPDAWRLWSASRRAAVTVAALLLVLPLLAACNVAPVHELKTTASIDGGASAQDTETFSFDPQGLADARRFDVEPTFGVPFVPRPDRTVTSADVRLEFDDVPEPVRGLELRVNGTRVGSLDLAQLRSQQGSFAIPLSVLAGRNELTLGLLLERSDACRMVAPGAWRLLRAGSIVLRSVPRALENSLALLPLPFIAPSDREATINVVLPRDGQTPLRAAGLVAGWLGVENAIALRFSVRQGSLPDTSAIVFVDGAQIAAALGLPAPEGPSVRMVDHPLHGGANVKLLVVGGRDPDEMLQAAQGLAAGPGSMKGEAKQFLPPVPRAARLLDDAPRWLPKGSSLTFSKLPYQRNARLSHDGVSGGAIAVRFRMAPDLGHVPGDPVELDLGYVVETPSGLRSPRLDLLINGTYLATLPPPQGDQGYTARTRVMVRRELLRGYNELVVQVSYAGAELQCGEAHRGIARVALLPDSTLGLAALEPGANSPDVRLFIDDGFPFTRAADLRETAIVLPAAPSAAELSSLLSVLAHFAQVTGIAGDADLLAADGLSAAPRGKDLLLIGTREDNALLGRLSPLLPFDGRARVPVSTNILLSLLSGFRGEFEVARARAAFDGAADVAAIEGLALPGEEGRSVLAITARTSDSIPQLPDAKGATDSNGPLGDLLLLTGGYRAMFQIGPVGRMDGLSRFASVQWTFSQWPLLLLPIALLGIALAARELLRALDARAAARFRNGVE